jgi:hypothetical protein
MVKWALRALVVLGLTCSMTDASEAQTFQWFNYSGDGRWENGSNWLLPDVQEQAFQPPTAGSNVLINGTAQEAVIDYRTSERFNEIIVGTNLRITSPLTGGDGSLRITNDGRVSASRVSIGVEDNRQGTVTIESGRLTTDQFLMGTLFDLVNNGQSTLNISGGELRVGETLSARSVGGRSNINVTGGELRANRFRLGALNEMYVGGTAFINQLDGRFDFSDSPEESFSGDQGGVLTVDGSNATIRLNRSSNSPAFRAHEGGTINFIADSGGFSAIVLTMGNYLNQLEIRDRVTLNVDALALGVGVYDLFTYSEVEGAFSSVNLTFADGFSGSLIYGENALQLQVVPEPSTWAVMSAVVLGAGGLGWRRRRLASAHAMA